MITHHIGFFLAMLFILSGCASHHAKPIPVAETFSSATPSDSTTFQIRQIRGSGLEAVPLAQCDRMILQHKSKLTGGVHEEVFYVEKPVLLALNALESATTVSNRLSGEWWIVINFTSEGLKQYEDLVRQGTLKRPATIIDGRLRSVKVLRLMSMRPQERRITGEFTEQEASDLAAKINEARKRL